MTTTISNGVTTITPIAVEGYDADMASDNVLHNVIGASARAVTLRPAGLRTGTMTVVFATNALAQSLVTMLGAAASFTLADSVFTSIGMVFVVSGKIAISLDPDSGVAWIVAFDFEEIGS